MRNYATAVLLLYATTVAAIGWHRAPSDEYQRGANDALTMTMVCMIDAREKRQNPNWMMLERQVAKRLHVVRVESWLGAEK